MPSLDEFARQKLGALEQAHLRRTLVPTGRSGRPLGRAQRPAAAVVLLQRLSRPEPASGAEGRRHRGDRAARRRRRRLAARHRRPSALCRAGAAAGAAQGHRGGLRVRLGLSRQRRHRPGPGRPRRPDPDRRAVPFEPLDRRAAVARRGAAVSPQRRRPCSPICSSSIAAASPARADRHRGRVLDGRRPRAARRACRAGARVRRLADGRRRPRPRFRRAPRVPTCRSASARCPRPSAPTAAISAPRSR